MDGCMKQVSRVRTWVQVTSKAGRPIHERRSSLACIALLVLIMSILLLALQTSTCTRWLHFTQAPHRVAVVATMTEYNVEKKIVGIHLRKFAESTSVRGIPRVLKSNDRGLHILWSVAVAVCSALLVWQTTEILLRYYSYDVVTGVQEAGYNTVRFIQLISLYKVTFNFNE